MTYNILSALEDSRPVAHGRVARVLSVRAVRLALSANRGEEPLE